MSTLAELNKELSKTIYEIIYHGGEDPEDKYEFLSSLVKDKSEKVIQVLYGYNTEIDGKKRKVNPLVEEQAKYREIKKQANEKIKDVKERKEYLQCELAKTIEILNKPYLVVKDSLDNDLYCQKDYSVSREVDDSKISIDEQKWELPVISNNELNLLSKILSGKIYPGNKKVTDLFEKLIDGSSKVLPKITELPENHPAIIKNIRPTVKITKTKPE